MSTPVVSPDAPGLVPPQELVQALLKARHIAVFTGAGISAESGIGTFRDGADGHWARFNSREMATVQGWRENRQHVWAWYEGRRADVLAATPNAGHMALANLAATLQQVHGQKVQVDVITQNVDNLHERAGSTSVIHLHGSLFAPRCFACARPGDFAPEPPDGSSTLVEPPRCTHCRGYIRPGVVWFGEDLPPEPWAHAMEIAYACDTMLVVGTSGVVYPAAKLPELVHKQGKFVAEVNPLPSALAPVLKLQWAETAARGLPALLQQIAIG